jgi:CDGSH-type Zn-finger protein
VRSRIVRAALGNFRLLGAVIRAKSNVAGSIKIHIPPEAIMAQIKIMARKNGPFRVDAPEGSVELVDADGQKYDLTGKTNFALCRCGGSVNKPFCDGTHSRVGFQAAEAAVRAEEQAKDQQKPKI